MKRKKIIHIIHFDNWRFLQLSVFFMVLMFVVPMLDQSWLLKSLLSFTFLNSILVVFSTEGEQLKGKQALLALWGCSMLFSLGTVLSEGGEYFKLFESLEIVSTSLMILFLIIEIMTYIFRKQDISVDSIFAALSVYMMIALFFALVYTFLFNFQQDSFRFAHDSITSLNSNAKSNMFYFSMVTLATLGYGDIVPFSNFARMFSILEAVIGQFYVAVIVAMVVGKIVINMSKQGTE